MRALITTLAVAAMTATAAAEESHLCRRGHDEAENCREIAEIEDWLNDPELDIVSVKPTPAGIQGAKVLTLRRGDVVFRAKWRASATVSRRSSPRRELAAYHVQKLFLDPLDYVVPPAAAHCFPVETYRKQVTRGARATFPGSVCGVLSYWIEDVEPLGRARRDGWFHGQHGHAFDPVLFLTSPSYKASVADVNLFAYLVAHADSHAANFVITSDRAWPWVYSVDNSLCLGLAKNKGLAKKHDWSVIRVPALRRASVERLRAHADGDALLVADLTRDESDAIRARIRELLRRVDAGEIAVF